VTDISSVLQCAADKLSLSHIDANIPGDNLLAIWISEYRPILTSCHIEY